MNANLAGITLVAWPSVGDIAVILAGITLVALPSVGVAKLAQHKGQPFGPWLVFTLVIGWPIALVVAVLLRRRKPAVQAV